MFFPKTLEDSRGGSMLQDNLDEFWPYASPTSGSRSAKARSDSSKDDLARFSCGATCVESCFYPHHPAEKTTTAAPI